MSADEEVAKLRAQLAAAVKRERETREVLEDLAHEKGLPEWLAAVVTERETVTSVLRNAANEKDLAPCAVAFGEHCTRGGAHLSSCSLAMVLRAMDPAWAKRELDLAYEEALREYADRTPYNARRTFGYSSGSDLEAFRQEYLGTFPTRESLEAMARRFSDSDQVDALRYVFDNPPRGIVVAPDASPPRSLVIREEEEIWVERPPTTCPSDGAGPAHYPIRGGGEPCCLVCGELWAIQNDVVGGPILYGASQMQQGADGLWRLPARGTGQPVPDAAADEQRRQHDGDHDAGLDDAS